MTTDNTPIQIIREKPKVIYRDGGGGAVYGLGLIGAWIYFIGQATTFWLGVLGFLKGIVWPIFLVYELLKYLNVQ
ncbi:MAG: hypothetical protein C3F13_01010 [Anaerolineales bacterium]|nr:hypothetical protein [Anaerolineae bacterium]PWB56681.1 MAG: hypothetical protein C3F13_01010 [Anaerolineales bacterium]